MTDDLDAQQLQAQRFEAVGRLAGGLAHDFNNVLTTIAGFAELALADLAAPEDNSEDTGEGNGPAADMREIIRECRMAAGLTHQLIAFSRERRVEPREHRLNDVVTTVDKMLRRLIGEHVELRLMLDPAAEWIKVVPGHLEQILINLAANARDAMPDGGVIAIETADVIIDEQRAGHLAAYNLSRPRPVPPGRYAMLCVSDTGMGMDEETLQRAFEPFFTTKGHNRGTGYGLATVHGIMNQSDGFIEVQSALGGGTTFKLYFPHHTEGTRILDREVPIPGPMNTRVSGGSETILVVEDEAVIRRLVRDMLSRNGYHVVLASDGAEAIDVANFYGDRVDLLFTDIVMPHVNGPALAARLAVTWPRLRVLYTSGYSPESVLHEVALDPCTNFIAKPFAPSALLRRIREVLDRP